MVDATDSRYQTLWELSTYLSNWCPRDCLRSAPAMQSAFSPPENDLRKAASRWSIPIPYQADRARWGGMVLCLGWKAAPGTIDVDVGAMSHLAALGLAGA